MSFLIAHLSLQRRLKQANADARQQLELRLGGLTSAIAELEVRVAELTRTSETPAAAAGRTPLPDAPVASEAAAANGAVSEDAAKSDAEIPVEILIVIGAAVTSFLGKKVRIRSAKMLQSPYEIVNPWAQQGRVIVQASHNLQVRHR